MNSEALVKEHFGYALRLYTRYIRTIPAHVDRDAVRGAALEGLVKAAQSFDDSKQVPFKNWAARRVIGQMRDEMRVQDHLSRRMRERVSEDDPALRVSPDAPLSLDEELSKLHGTDIENLTYAEMLTDPLQENLADGVVNLDHDELHMLLGSLPEREFKVLVLRYYEGMRVTEVALAMGLSESRINQIETRALSTMRGALLAA